MLLLSLLSLTACEKTEMSEGGLPYFSQSQLTKWRDKTDKRIEDIRQSPNMEIPEDVDVYYIIGDDDERTNDNELYFSELGQTLMRPGSYVLFKRGEVFRGSFRAKPGFTYSAYGEGPKPIINVSPFNAADPSYWEQTDAPNVWKLTQQLYTDDVGTVVFNNESFGRKCVLLYEEDGVYNQNTGKLFSDYHDLDADLHFYYEYQGDGILYLYSEGNPGERFDSIEFNVKSHGVYVGGNNVTVDNLCIMHAGGHGVGAGSVNNLTVTNCEFAWIGGAIQAPGLFGRNFATRYGNAIEIYGTCDGFYVKDNYIWQVYDAGITQQLTFDVGRDENGAEYDNGAAFVQKNIEYCGNVIEYCNYSTEFWLGSQTDIFLENSYLENFLIEDNYMWYAGFGLCEDRPDRRTGTHLRGWYGALPATDFIVRNNFMYSTEWWIIRTMSEEVSLPLFEGNIIVGEEGIQFGRVFKNQDPPPYDGNIEEYLGETSKNNKFYHIKGE